MDFIFSKHAEEQMLRRNISKEAVAVVVSHPEQKITDSENPDITVFQSLIKEDGQTFLLRAFVNRTRQPNVVVTIYKTTKIHKYYEGKI
jgi:hypothetical protein